MNHPKIAQDYFAKSGHTALCADDDDDVTNDQIAWKGLTGFWLRKGGSFKSQFEITPLSEISF